MGLGAFIGGWGLGGAVIGFLAGIISFIWLSIILYSPAISLIATYHIIGLLALVIYVVFVLTIVATVSGLIGTISGIAGGVRSGHNCWSAV